MAIVRCRLFSSWFSGMLFKNRSVLDECRDRTDIFI